MLGHIETTHSSPPPVANSWRRLRNTAARGAQDVFFRAVGAVADCLRGVAHGGLTRPQPLRGAANQWTYVPFRDTCDSLGGPVGLGLNLRPGAQRLVIFLGGGAVGTDAATCRAGASCAAADLARTWWLQGAGIFNRQDPNNPLADASYVVIPAVNYDRHMGDRLALYPGQQDGEAWALCAHRGGANLKAFLRRIVPTFLHVKQVVLVGESAGGFGVSYHVPRVRTAFPGKELLVINDSGPYLPRGHELFNGAKVAEWGLRKTVARGWERLLPSDRDCEAGSWNLYGLTAKLSLRAGPPVRTALVTSVWDACIAQSYNLTLPQFEAAVRALPALADQQDPHTRVFLINQPGHTWLRNLEQVNDPGARAAVPLGRFLDCFLRGVPAGHVAQTPWWQGVVAGASVCREVRASGS